MKPNFDINYTPPFTGELFMRSDEKVRFLKGPIGSGKSTVCLMEIARRCAEMPISKDGFRRSRWVIIRNTLPQLKTTTKKSWDQWFPSGVAGLWKEQDKTFYLELGDIRAEILFLPLDSPDDTNRLLSLELTGAFINEAREVAPEIIQAVFSRLGRYPSRAMLAPGTEYWYGLIMDSNPPSRDSWLYETFEENLPEGWAIFKQPGGLSPDAENRENLPETYYEDMMHGATEDWINVHVHGQYGRSLSGRPVFEKSFKREFHVLTEVPRVINSREYPLIVALDFGRTPAAVIGQRDPRGHATVHDGLYIENIGLRAFLQQHLKPLLARKFPLCRYLVVGDPAGWAKSQTGEESCFDVLREEGFTAVRAPTNDIDKRIEAVEKLLGLQLDGKAMLRFAPASTSPGMKHLITGLDGSYKYKRRTDGSFDTSPLKDKFSHCFTGEVLVETPDGPRCIDAIRVGDYVSTPFGARMVTDTMARRTSDFVELEFAGGVRWSVTVDHPVYTKTGIVLSDALQYSDILFTQGENACARQNTPFSSSKARSSTTSLLGTIKQVFASAANTCTALFGSFTMGRSLTGTTSTTSTATRPTTRLTIWPALKQGITRAITHANDLKATLAGGSARYPRRESPPPSGTGRQQASSGTASTGVRRGKGAQRSCLHVRTAENRLSDFVEQISADIVALRARAWRVSSPGSMTSRGSALFAEVTSELINMQKLAPAPRIVGVRRYRTPKPVAVHDLTVSDAHCFFAGGILVSNCNDALQYFSLGVDLSGGRDTMRRREVTSVSARGWT